MEKKYEHMKFIIQRFDHYYDTVNNKGIFYIGLNTFILGGLCVGFTNLNKSVNTNIWIWLILIALTIGCFLSIFFTIYALKPYLKDNLSNIDNPSLMFFGGIARHELSYLKQKFSEQTIEQINEDAVQQIHSLASGLNYKFQKLGAASYLLVAQFYLLAPLFILIIKNLK